MTITGNFERFHYSNFETSFLKKKNFFEKLEYRFLVETTSMKNATFPYKTAQIKWGVQNGPIAKSRVFSHS